MAASSRSTNTFQEELVKQLQSVAPLMASPDATPQDIAWLFQNIQLPIIKKIREPLDDSANSGTTNYPPPSPGIPGGGAIPPEMALALAASANGGPGMPPGMPGGPPPGIGGPPGMPMLPPGVGPSPSMRPPGPIGVPGVMPSPSPQATGGAVDELRRMIGANAQ